MGDFRIAVLASGSGSDLQSVIDGVEDGSIDGRIVVVISDNEDAYALTRAEDHGIEPRYVSRKGLKREEHEEAVTAVIQEFDVDLIVLAGYIRILTPAFIVRHRGKMINIHPALLPLYGGPGMYGMHVHEAVLASGDEVSGCSVHFVDENVDGGPIIAQRTVPVLADDTAETLQARVLEEEHRLLPEVVGLIAAGRVTVDGDRVIVAD